MDTPSNILQSVAFLDHVSASLIMPQIPPHAARSLGCNHLLIGTMMAIYPAFQLISGPVMKTWGNIIGKKTLLVITLSLCGLSYVVLGITSSVFLFLSLRAVIGFFKNTQRLTKELAPVYESDKKKVPDIDKGLNLASGAGMVVGPVLGGHVMGIMPDFGFTFIALAVGVIYATNSYLIRKLPDEKQNEKNKQIKETPSLAPRLAMSVTTSLIRTLEQFRKIDWSKHSEPFLLLILITLSTGMYFCNFALYLKFKHFASAENLGYVTSVFTISGILFGRFAMKYIKEFYKDDKDYSMRIYHVFLTLTLTFIAMAFVPGIKTYVICMISFTACNILSRKFIRELIESRVDEKEKETYSDAVNAIMNVGGVVAPIIAGALGQFIGILNIIYILMLIAGAGAYRSHKMVPKFIVKTNISKSKSE